MVAFSKEDNSVEYSFTLTSRSRILPGSLSMTMYADGAAFLQLMMAVSAI